MGISAVRGAAVAGTLAGAGLLLGWASPPSSTAGTLLDSQAALERSGPDAVALAIAGAGGWVVLAWLIVAVLTVAAGALPGWCGRAAARVGSVTAPPLLRRVVAISLGLAVVTATSALPAQAAQRSSPPAAGSAFDFDWPVPGRPERPVHPPGQPTVRQTSGSPQAMTVVRPGDSLWAIARRHLPARAGYAAVAAAWPRWYAANRSVVGPDPGLLRPGQRLVAPVDLPGGPS